MVEQNRSGAYTQIVYAPSGAKLALMNGSTLQKGFVPLTGGAMAVYNSSGLDHYRHSDWVGSSRFASTPSRTMYSDGAYAPFGEPYTQTGSTDLSFTGMNQDTVSNLYDFPAREYGIQGRWPSPDPAGVSSMHLGDPQTLNRYAYVRNNPLGLTDPTGEDYIECEIPGMIPCGQHFDFFGGIGFGYPSADFSFLGVQYYMDGIRVPANVALGALGAGAAVQCPDNACSGFGTDSKGNTAYVQFYAFTDGTSGYFKPSDLTHGINTVNGQLMDDTNYGYYLQRTYPQQIADQAARLDDNLAKDFPGKNITVRSANPEIAGGHANFTLSCPRGCPAAGRYDNGVHIVNGGLVHNDTVSPWTGPFSFSALFSANFWEHDFVDLIGGQFVPLFAH